MVAMRDEEVLYSVYIQYSVYSNQNDMSFCYEICVWGGYTMSVIETIKQRILELDAGPFQNMCNAFLSKEGYGH